jgi:hypothetical protein
MLKSGAKTGVRWTAVRDNERSAGRKLATPDTKVSQASHQSEIVGNQETVR